MTITPRQLRVVEVSIIRHKTPCALQQCLGNSAVSYGGWTPDSLTGNYGVTVITGTYYGAQNVIVLSITAQTALMTDIDA